MVGITRSKVFFFWCSGTENPDRLARRSCYPTRKIDDLPKVYRDKWDISIVFMGYILNQWLLSESYPEKKTHEQSPPIAIYWLLQNGRGCIACALHLCQAEEKKAKKWGTNPRLGADKKRWQCGETHGKWCIDMMLPSDKHTKNYGNHHVQWVDSRTKSPFSIAMLNYQRAFFFLEFLGLCFVNITFL